MKKTLIPEGTPLFENIARNQIPEILESLSAVQKDYHKMKESFCREIRYRISVFSSQAARIL